MKRTLIVCAMAVAVGLVSARQPVQAGGNGGAVAAGVIGGLAAGAILGGAMAQPRPYYAPAYAPAPVYVVPQEEMCVERQQVWSPRYQAYVVRNVRVPCY